MKTGEKMSTRNEMGSRPRVADRFALVAGCTVSLAAMWYASDMLRAPRGGGLLLAGALFLLGLSLVAQAHANRLRWPLIWSALVLMTVEVVWFRS